MLCEKEGLRESDSAEQGVPFWLWEGPLEAAAGWRSLATTRFLAIGMPFEYLSFKYQYSNGGRQRTLMRGEAEDGALACRRPAGMAKVMHLR